MIKIQVYKITGVSPLLQNNPASMAMVKSGINTKKVTDPKEEAERVCYRNDEGNLYINTMCFRASLLKGCLQKRIGKTSASRIVSGGVFNCETQAELLDPKTKKPIKNYDINIARCVIMGHGILKARPEIKNWSCLIGFEIDTTLLSPQDVLELLNIAGRMAGVGDWRPEKKGIYGRFKAEFN